jgi:hypothetical protein
MNTRPDDFDVRYTWREGSVPPPNYYEYQIHVAASGAATINVTPDYPAQDVTVWTNTFTVSTEQLDALYRRMLQLGLLSTLWQADAHPPIGGSNEALSVRVQGRQIELPFFVDPELAARAHEIYAAVQALVPLPLWNTLKIKLQQRILKLQ